jgi:predicted amidohydrolase
MIIDPWGKVLSNAGTQPGMAIADMKTDVLAEVRRKLPVLEHRRL